MSTQDTDCTGTARTLHEMSEYEMLEFDYDEETALSVTTKAFQRNFPDITRDDVKGAVKVHRAMRTGKVDVAAERQRMEDQAQRATAQILQDISQPEEETQD
ncbi:hypothetical protein ACLHT5_04090 [Pseudomonas aeruginosa]|uniref:hypothetical protein n=1 Tax=Pseudomonas aeruginosa TaxID=287 RepID=UPI00276EC97F|nr:hypothetical protein [Pseudomonas aeruginosa]